MIPLERFLKKINLSILIILVVSSILTVIWFKHGNIMGTAESGLTFYDFNFQLNLNKEAWSSYTLGSPNNIGVASIPMYWFFAKLQNIGIPSFLLQMFFFWLILVSSGISIFLLAKHFFPKLENRLLLLSVFFYWFNPFSLVNIWNRFLTNFLVSYAFIPIALYLFIRGIKEKRYIFVFFIGLLSFICSHAQTSMTFNILLWLMLFYTAAFNLLISKDWQIKKFIIKFFLLTLFFWIVINAWWLGQVVDYFFVGSFRTISTSSFTSFGNYQTFSTISKTLGNLSDLIRLRHNYFIANDLLWTSIFNTPLFWWIGFIVAGVILIPIVFTKNRISFFFGGFFLLGLFLSKGNNSPFGEINDSLFLSFPLMQLFRNPFEKFGYLIAFSSTFLYTYGIYLIYKVLNKQYKKYLYSSAFLIIILIWGFPFWTRLVFVGFEEPINNPAMGYEVKVPQYYKNASKWLDSQKGDFRILVLPMSGEGITYQWQKGYSGLELTNQLLPVSAISLNTNIPFYNDVSKKIERLSLRSNDLSSLANSLNIKYIMLRQDVDWDLRKIKNPNTVLSILLEKEQKGQIKKVAEFGALSFWEILSERKGTVYASNSALLDYSKSDIEDLDFSRNDLVISSKNEVNGKLTNQTEGEVIHPHAKFFLDHPGEDSFEIRQDIFPYVSVLPTNKWYFLVLLKDRLEEETIRDLDNLLEYRVTKLGKRLVEVKLSEDLKSEKGVLIALKQYRSLLNRTFNLVDNFEKNDQSKQAYLQSKLYLLFLRHIKVLENLINDPNTSNQTKQEGGNTLKQLKDYLVQSYIYPDNGFMVNDKFPLKKRVLYSFNVLDAGDYELVWDQKIMSGYYKLSIGNQIILQLDDKSLMRKFENDGRGYVSLGKINLSKGIHEIGINFPEALNLVDAPQQINFKVDHGNQVYSFPVKSYDAYSSYGIDFDYWIKKGNGVLISVYDKKPEDISSTTQSLKKLVVGPDIYDYTAKNFFAGFKLPEGTDQATVSLTVFPWNNCETIYFTKKEVCRNEAFRSRYDKTTEVEIKNLSVVRDFNDIPILVRDSSTQVGELPKLAFTKLDESTYQVKVQDATRPFFLVFSELFDPEWKILDTKGNILNYQHILANGYANSWYIDKTGSYQIVLKFTPQNLLDYGERISFAAVFIGLLAVILLEINRRRDA